MVSNNFQALQHQVISYVDRSKGGILTAARNIDPRICAQDVDDLVSEGYIIALEILANGDIDKLEELFWVKLKRSVWDSYAYIFDHNHVATFSNDDGEYQEDSHHLQNALAKDPIEKCAYEHQFEHLAASVLDFLTPSEMLVLCLVLGLTSRGSCGISGASLIMGVSRATVRRLYGRILEKVKGAIRQRSPSGLVTLSKPKKKPKKRPVIFH